MVRPMNQIMILATMVVKVNKHIAKICGRAMSVKLILCKLGADASLVFALLSGIVSSCLGSGALVVPSRGRRLFLFFTPSESSVIEDSGSDLLVSIWTFSSFWFSDIF